MKNVIIYNKINTSQFGGKQNDYIIENYLKAQVENSLHYGWEHKNIVIATNFDFEHSGIKNVSLTDICYDNGFNNKWFGIRELFHKYFNEQCWLHDYDDWQINDIDFPKFDGLIGGCTYIFSNEWNTASMFIKPNSHNLLDYVYDFLVINKHVKFDSGENAICAIRQINEIKHYFSNLNQQYNIGLTKLKQRYDAAEKPVKVLGCKLLHSKHYNLFLQQHESLNLIPPHLSEIISRYVI